MNYSERHDDILAVLLKEKIVSVAKLAKLLYVSEATIRRDLIRMDQLGLIRRTHGGAMISKNNAQESSFAMREMENLNAKKLVCGLAVNYIKDHSVIYIDSSSTLIPLVPMLKRFEHLTIITHGIRTALLLSHLDNIEVHVAGGQIENFSNSILGSSVIEYYDLINADIALLSCSGINSTGGITDNSLEHAKIKQKIIEKSAQVFLLIDQTKFNKTLMSTSTHIRNVDMLFTDTKPNKDFVDMIASNQCILITP
jgi:DeoR family transcriptional regulator, carbon catabolite repression regulator